MPGQDTFVIGWHKSLLFWNMNRNGNSAGTPKTPNRSLRGLKSSKNAIPHPPKGGADSHELHPYLADILKNIKPGKAFLLTQAKHRMDSKSGES